MGRIRSLCCGLAAAFALLATEASAAERRSPPPAPAPAPAAAGGGQVSQAATPSPYGMIYTPIVPCRAFGGQAVAAAQTKGFLISGASNLTAQGGPVGGCGVPAYAQAVSINISSGTSTAQGYLTAYATGASRPNQASLSYRAYPATTGSIVQLGTGGRISVFASAATRVTGDVTGYYEKQIWAFIDYYGTVLNSSGRVTGVTVNATGQYTVSFDRNLNDCTASATPNFGPKMTNVYLYSNNVQVAVFQNTGAFVNADFYLQVTC